MHILFAIIVSINIKLKFLLLTVLFLSVCIACNVTLKRVSGLDNRWMGVSNRPYSHVRRYIEGLTVFSMAHTVSRV